MHDYSEKKKQQKTTITRTLTERYEEVPKRHGRLHWTSPPLDSKFLTFKQIRAKTYLDIFLKFVPSSLVQKIISNLDLCDTIIRHNP